MLRRVLGLGHCSEVSLLRMLGAASATCSSAQRARLFIMHKAKQQRGSRRAVAPHSPMPAHALETPVALPAAAALSQHDSNGHTRGLHAAAPSGRPDARSRASPLARPHRRAAAKPPEHRASASAPLARRSRRAQTHESKRSRPARRASRRQSTPGISAVAQMPQRAVRGSRRPSMLVQRAPPTRDRGAPPAVSGQRRVASTASPTRATSFG